MAANLNPETDPAPAAGEAIMCLCCPLLADSNPEPCGEVIPENVRLQATAASKHTGVCESRVRGVGWGMVDRDGFEALTDNLNSEYYLV